MIQGHQHFWLECARRGQRIIAVCNCKTRGEFYESEWERLATDGQAKNRPVIV